MKNRLFFLFSFFVFSFATVVSQSLVTIQGRITDEWGNSLENVIISVKETNSITYSNVEGRYRLEIPANQNVVVKFHYSLTDTIITINSSKKEHNITLSLKGETLQTVDITARYNDNYVRIDPKLNYKIPTPGGGLESLIKLLPGVSSTNELSSQYNVRGGNFDENLIYVNDIEIYKSFLVRNAQQEGLSFVNLDLTNSVKFSAGGFEARYGDKMSSVMDVEYKQPTSYGGSVMASMLGASGHVEGNVNDKFIFLAGIRFRSNAYLFTSLDTKGVYKPTFFDTQLQLTWKPIKKLEITLLGVFSNNSYFQRPESREQALGSITSSQKIYVLYDGQEVDQYENYLGGLTFKYNINDHNHLRLILSSYYAQEKETYDILYRYNIRETEADLGASGRDYVEEGAVIGTGAYREHARNSMNAIVSAADLRGEHRIKHSVLSWGVKFQNEVIYDRLREWSFIDSSGHILPISTTGVPGDSVPLDDPSRIIQLPENRFVSAVNELNTFRLSGFVQNVWNIDGDSATRFKLNTGIRFHYWSYNNEFVCSPRINFIYKPHWKNDWTFFLRTGLYYQPPFYREFRNAKGELNKDIEAQRSIQVVAAAEYNFKLWRRPFKFTAEVYYKYLDNLISYNVENVKIVYSALNDAKGYATGIDLKWSGEFIEGLESWIALSLMKTSENIVNDFYYDRDGNKIEPSYLPRPTDQPFAINLFFQDHFPGIPSFRIHLNFVFASGLPYSFPNGQRTYINNHGKEVALRTSMYKRVDVGFSYMFLEQTRDRMKHKTKALRTIKNMGLFFEVFNLLDTQNVSSYKWFSTVGGLQTPVPDYLTGRLFNLKFVIEI